MPGKVKLVYRDAAFQAAAYAFQPQVELSQVELRLELRQAMFQGWLPVVTFRSPSELTRPCASPFTRSTTVSQMGSIFGFSKSRFWRILDARSSFLRWMR